MQSPFDNIVQHLFHQPSLQSVTVDELERMAQQHPYFAAAHFLLLKKMQVTGHPHFSTQLHKTTLYFNNPLWLQFLLQPETVANFTVSEKPPFITSETGEVTDAAEKNEAENTPEHIAATINHSTGQEPVNEEWNQNKETIAEASAQHLSGTTAPSTEHAGELITEADETITIIEPAGEHIAAIISEEPGEAEKEMPVIAAQESIAEENNVESSREEIAMPLAVIAEENDNDATSLQAAEIQEQNSAETIAIAPEIPEPAINNDEKPLSLFKTVIETPAAKNDLLFEPYHTVDYFASQGIKLSKIEAESKDKLGRQLKSFTEWLKSMKKLPQVSIDKILAENEETKVVEDAIHSIENKEVITEAMAEVFEKQGLTEKAAEVYQKLSLLNPGKSAYFAAKIAILKH